MKYHPLNISSITRYSFGLLVTLAAGILTWILCKCSRVLSAYNFWKQLVENQNNVGYVSFFLRVNIY